MINTFGQSLRNSETESQRELGEKMIEKIYAAAQPGVVFSRRWSRTSTRSSRPVKSLPPAVWLRLGIEHANCGRGGHR